MPVVKISWVVEEPLVHRLLSTLPAKRKDDLVQRLGVSDMMGRTQGYERPNVGLAYVDQAISIS